MSMAGPGGRPQWQPNTSTVCIMFIGFLLEEVQYFIEDKFFAVTGHHEMKVSLMGIFYMCIIC
jgi:hypothetical protein